MTNVYAQFAGAFEHKTRLDGSEFWTLKDDAPDAFLDMVYELHDGRLPSDVAYREIRAVAQDVCDCGIGYDIDDLTIESDYRNSDLLEWAGENSDVIDEYIDDMGGEYNGFFNLISAAQAYARENMARRLYDLLTEYGESLEEEIESEDEEDNE